MNVCANSKDYWKARCENAEDQLTRLKKENEKLVSYIQNGIECFANPCLDHSGVNTPPFSKFQERYGNLCLMCVVDELEAIKEENKEFRKISADRSETIDRLVADGVELEEENERLKALVASLGEATTKVRYIDSLGASRNSPADCRDGIRYVTVDDTIYWPLSEEDAQLLRSAECGRGEFTGPSHRLITAVSVPDEEVAKMFHENYEKLAPSFGYETREETRRNWEEVPPNNKALMIAVVKQIRSALLTPSHNVTLGVDNGQGNLFVHGDYDSIKTVQDRIFELEKLRAKLAELEMQTQNDAMRFALSEMVRWYENISLGNSPAFQYYDLAKKALLSADRAAKESANEDQK